MVQLHKKAVYGKTNEVALNINEVMTGFSYTDNQFYVGGSDDFRIFVSCTEEVKLIGRIVDPVDSWGDQFLIPSLKNAGTQYTFAMPTSDGSAKGLIAILPINTEDYVKVHIVGYSNGALFSSKDIEYSISRGRSQYYISIDLFTRNSGNTLNYNNNVSISITTTSDVMISFASVYATTSNTISLCGVSCIDNYVTFMPTASSLKPCNTLLTPPDQRMITNHFTTRLHLSPPNLGSFCSAITSITVYDGVDNIQGTEEIVDKMGFTEISLMNNAFAGFSTDIGEVNTNRFGSITDGNKITNFGHFMHYVPSTVEWLSGKTQFFTSAKKCVLEFYADADGSNGKFIKIDGSILETLKFDRTPLPIFENKYSQFIVTINGYGLHTIENPGKYVAYVICENGPTDAAGYLTGFNQRK
uniref:IgGFc_binding domain-containing protein n=1 Tax=Rhabditophanes sp. KR3021 TaxID=114890 RepID=A0AC35TU50_9BILA